MKLLRLRKVNTLGQKLLFTMLKSFNDEIVEFIARKFMVFEEINVKVEIK